MQAENKYHGLMLNLSNCSNMKRMQACLNDIALKASDNSYISETLSTEISLRNVTRKHQRNIFTENFLRELNKKLINDH